MTDTRGLTLVEVLISIAVIGIMFAALAGLQISNIRVTSQAGRDTQQLEKAVDVFEEVKGHVEADFATYNACTLASAGLPCKPDTFDDARFDVTVTVDGAPISGTGTGATGEVVLAGIVEVIVAVAEKSDGRAVEFRQFIPCLDAAQPPTISHPGECLL